MIATKTAEIIQQLKQIRQERGLSYQRIVDMVEDSGGAISMSTVRRVFAEGSEEQNFRYGDTIKPLVVALLEVNKPPALSEDATLEQHEADALRTVIALKEQINQSLMAENERLKEDYEKKLAYVKAESEKKSEHIVALTEQNASCNQRIHAKYRTIFWLSLGLIVLLSLVCLVLIVDLLNSDIGFIRVFAGNSPLAIAGIVVVLVSAVVVFFEFKEGE